MSSFLRELIHPKTGKKQVAFCIDDFYGSHRYGYCFPKDGSDAYWDMFNEQFSYKDKCDCFKVEDIEAHKRAKDLMRLKDCNN